VDYAKLVVDTNVFFSLLLRRDTALRRRSLTDGAQTFHPRFFRRVVQAQGTDHASYRTECGRVVGMPLRIARPGALRVQSPSRPQNGRGESSGHFAAFAALVEASLTSSGGDSGLRHAGVGPRQSVFRPPTSSHRLPPTDLLSHRRTVAPSHGRTVARSHRRTVGLSRRLPTSSVLLFLHCGITIAP